MLDRAWSVKSSSDCRGGICLFISRIRYGPDFHIGRPCEIFQRCPLLFVCDRTLDLRSWISCSKEPRRSNVAPFRLPTLQHSDIAHLALRTVLVTGTRSRLWILSLATHQLLNKLPPLPRRHPCPSQGELHPSLHQARTVVRQMGHIKMGSSSRRE